MFTESPSASVTLQMSPCFVQLDVCSLLRWDAILQSLRLLAGTYFADSRLQFHEFKYVLNLFRAEHPMPSHLVNYSLPPVVATAERDKDCVAAVSSATWSSSLHFSCLKLRLRVSLRVLDHGFPSTTRGRQEALRFDLSDFHYDTYDTARTCANLWQGVVDPVRFVEMEPPDFALQFGEASISLCVPRGHHALPSFTVVPQVATTLSSGAWHRSRLLWVGPISVPDISGLAVDSTQWLYPAFACTTRALPIPDIESRFRDARSLNWWEAASMPQARTDFTSSNDRTSLLQQINDEFEMRVAQRSQKELVVCLPSVQVAFDKLTYDNVMEILTFVSEFTALPPPPIDPAPALLDPFPAERGLPEDVVSSIHNEGRSIYDRSLANSSIFYSCVNPLSAEPQVDGGNDANLSAAADLGHRDSNRDAQLANRSLIDLSSLSASFMKPIGFQAFDGPMLDSPEISDDEGQTDAHLPTASKMLESTLWQVKSDDSSDQFFDASSHITTSVVAYPATVAAQNADTPATLSQPAVSIDANQRRSANIVSEPSVSHSLVQPVEPFAVITPKWLNGLTVTILIKSAHIFLHEDDAFSYPVVEPLSSVPDAASRFQRQSFYLQLTDLALFVVSSFESVCLTHLAPISTTYLHVHLSDIELREAAGILHSPLPFADICHHPTLPIIFNTANTSRRGSNNYTANATGSIGFKTPVGLTIECLKKAIFPSSVSLADRKYALVGVVVITDRVLANNRHMHVELQASGVTLQLFLESQWSLKLTNFFSAPVNYKPPPGPIRQDFIQVSVQLFDIIVDYNPNNHSGRLVVIVERADVATNITEESLKTSFKLNLHDGAVYLLDQCPSIAFEPIGQHPSLSFFLSLPQEMSHQLLVRSCLERLELSHQIEQQRALMSSYHIAAATKTDIPAHAVHASREQPVSGGIAFAIVDNFFSASAAPVPPQRSASFVAQQQFHEARLPIVLQHMSKDVFDYLELVGFAKVASLDRIQLQMTSMRSLENTTIELSGNQVLLSICSDSLDTLTGLIGHMNFELNSVVTPLPPRHPLSASFESTSVSVESSVVVPVVPDTLSLSIADAMHSRLVPQTMAVKTSNSLSVGLFDDYAAMSASDRKASSPVLMFAESKPQVAISQHLFIDDNDAVGWQTESGYAPPIYDSHFRLPAPDMGVAAILSGLTSTTSRPVPLSKSLVLCDLLSIIL
jgi:hypothetical protein